MSNVYVVLAGEFPVVFTDETDAVDYANLTGTGPVWPCAVRTREMAAEMREEMANA